MLHPVIAKGKPMRHLPAALLLAVLPEAATAQAFTTAAEVRPILELTRANWVAIGTQTGQDLLYFTQILSWRCGLSEIRYGINGAPPEQVFEMEPCYADTNQPNAIRALPYVGYGLGSIESVTVEIVYEDGVSDGAAFTRAEVLLH